MDAPAGWEIPQLDPAMQALEVIAPVTTWGAIGRARPMPGTYVMYTDDYRMTAVWKDPATVVRSGCKVVTELNYSSFDISEPEEVLKGIYRKRVLARYWQMNGLRILVDLDVAPEYLDYALLGVPAGWKAYATRSHRLSQMTTLEAEYDLAVEHAGGEEGLLFVVYGGGKKVRRQVEERSWISLPEHIEVARGRALPYGGITAIDLWKGIKAGQLEPSPP